MSEEYCVDANLFIAAWNESYPRPVFPSLWKVLARHRDDIVLIKPIYDEIDPFSQSDKNKSLDEKRKQYPLRMWLEGNNFLETPIDGSVERESLRLEKEYETDPDNKKGASQNDIRLIAYAGLKNKTVVTLEAEQPNKPGKKSNYKIPLICSEERVRYINFVRMLEKLRITV